MVERLEYPQGAVALGRNTLNISTLGIDAFEKMTEERLYWLIIIGSLGETQRNEGKLTMIGGTSKRGFANT